MRCSRVALSLLLAVLGGAVLALTPTDGRRGVAADIDSAPPAYLNSAKEVNDYQGAYDWGDNEHGYVYSRPEGQFGNDRESFDSMAADEDAYTNDQSETRQYDFEDEYSSDDYQYTDDSASDQTDYIYNDHGYNDANYDYDYGYDEEYGYDDATNAQADYEYDADESMYGREAYGYPVNEYAADQDFGHSRDGYCRDMEDDVDDEIDAEVYNEMYDTVDDEMDYGMDDEVDDEMGYGMDDTVDDEMGYGMDDEVDDEMDDETVDEGNGYSYEYAYPESRYGYSMGMDEYFEEEIDSNRGSEDSTSEDCSSEDSTSEGYSNYDEFGYDNGDWGGAVDEMVDEAEGVWTKGSLDAGGDNADTTSTETTPSDTHFGQYECWDSKSGEVSEGSWEEESSDYEYADPEDSYGGLFIEPMSAASRQQGLLDLAEPTRGSRPSGREAGLRPRSLAMQGSMGLFARSPAELLLATDRELLMSLERLCEEPSGTRRAALNEYIECRGMEAIDFATRFEDTTGSEVLGLADDLPGCAALLATFRLLERGELNVEEAVDLLRRSMTALSREWIEGVSDITADAFEESGENGSPTVSASRPLFGTVISLAAQSLDDLGGAICSLSRRLDALKGRF